MFTHFTNLKWSSHPNWPKTGNFCYNYMSRNAKKYIYLFFFFGYDSLQNYLELKILIVLTTNSEFSRQKLSQYFLKQWEWPQHRSHLAVPSMTFKPASRAEANKQRRQRKKLNPCLKKVQKFYRDQRECYMGSRIWSLFDVVACLTLCNVRKALISMVIVLSHLGFMFYQFICTCLYVILWHYYAFIFFNLLFNFF